MLTRLFQMRFWRLSLFALFLVVTQSVLVKANASISAADIPMLALKSAPGLVMLTMSRDQRLFYSAYNEVTDLDGDGVLDVGYKESIKYYGYFVSDRCYAYDSTNNRFSPKSIASTTDGCLSAPSSARWHGNWLNWMTTSRIDALRKVLYGGKRSTDTSALTVLEAAPIPLDSHIWGKEFRPTAAGGTDTYKIQYYTPLSAPDSGKQHMFLMKSSETTTTAPYIGAIVPALRVVKDVDAKIDRVWLWASSERPVGGASGATTYTRQNKSGSDKVINPTPSLISYGVPGFPNSTSGGTTYGSSSPSYEYKLNVRVEACVNLSPGGRETGCTGYPVSSTSPTVYKPTGVLHDYSNNDQLKFGLLTGSYTNNYSGGVLRKDIGSFTDEFSSSTGIFTNVGVVKTINAITSVGLQPSDQLYLSNSVDTTTCPVGSLEWNRLRCQGEVNMWGAPVAEMMYEGLRYFTDKQPLAAFTTGVTSGTSSTSLDGKLGLPLVSTWSNPFRPKASGGNPICSKPVQMVIADPITSFDSDQVPGAAFTPDTGKGSAIPATDLTGLNVATEADAIWASEFGASVTKKFFIGQTTATNADGNPSRKDANTFKYLRGHAPDETNTQGSYYAASIAKFAHGTYDADNTQLTGVKVGPTGSTKVLKPVDTISVALGSVVPRFEITYGGNTVSLVPFSKSIAGGTCSPAPAVAVSAPSGFQPTGLITGMFIDRIANTASSNTDSSINGSRPFARFMVSFSDMDVGGDNEADANVYYTVWIDNAGKLNVRMDPYDTATCTDMHMGYVMSGTTSDGLYLDVRSTGSTSSKYYLDTPPAATGPAVAPWGTPSAVLSNVSSSRQFTLSTSSTTATYVPHDPLWYAAKYGHEIDPASTVDPSNYFKVTNASALPAQMEKAFRSAAALAAVASTSVVGVGQRSAGTAAIYQSSYDSLTWSSRLYAFKVGVDGVASDTPSWDASQLIDVPTARHLYLGRGGTTTPVALTATGTDWSSTSLTTAEQANFGTYDQYKYLLGDKTYEERKAVATHVAYRNRGTTFLADSTPAKNSAASVLGDVVNSDPQIVTKKNYGYADSTYTTFVNGINYETLAVSANDGFFHIFDASLPTVLPDAPNPSAGKELFAFMPRKASVNIKDLSDPAYKHRYFLDGPIAVGHAKIPVNTDASVDWRSILVGTGGLGAKTVFAVDASSKTFSAASVLWEMDEDSLSATNKDKLGHVVGKPQIGKLANGTWVAIFSNGYSSTNDKAYLFVVNLQTGAVVKVLDTNVTPGNGLTSIAIVRKTSGDTDAIDYVYGADYLGNIWRFDLSSTSSSSWTTSLIYNTSGRYITGEISVGTPPTAVSGGAMIYFGTGRYLTSTDASDSVPPATPPVNALYGVYDNQLWSSDITAYISSDTALSTGVITMASATADTRLTTMPTTSWWTISGKKGWVVPLSGTNVTAGERVIAPPVRYTQAGKVDAFLFTSIVPGIDECVAGLDTWITAIDPMTGSGALAFKGLTDSSVKIVGGSPRGVFVLSETKAPTLYISQTVFDISKPPTSTYGTIAGGSETVCINGICGETRVLGIELTPGSVSSVSINRRQVWRQLK